jgi:hypothetical protein
MSSPYKVHTGVLLRVLRPRPAEFTEGRSAKSVSKSCTPRWGRGEDRMYLYVSTGSKALTDLDRSYSGTAESAGGRNICQCFSVVFTPSR